MSNTTEKSQEKFTQDSRDKYIRSRPAPMQSQHGQIVVDREMRTPQVVIEVCKDMLNTHKTRILAIGSTITKALTVADVIRSNVSNVHLIVRFSTKEEEDKYYPVEQGLDIVTIQKSISFLELQLEKNQKFNIPKDTVGYNEPQKLKQPITFEELIKHNEEILENYQKNQDSKKGQNDGEQRGSQKKSYSKSQNEGEMKSNKYKDNTRGYSKNNNNNNNNRGDYEGGKGKSQEGGYYSGGGGGGHRKSNYPRSREENRDRRDDRKYDKENYSKGQDQDYYRNEKKSYYKEERGHAKIQEKRDHYQDGDSDRKDEQFNHRQPQSHNRDYATRRPNRDSYSGRRDQSRGERGGERNYQNVRISEKPKENPRPKDTHLQSDQVYREPQETSKYRQPEKGTQRRGGPRKY